MYFYRLILILSFTLSLIGCGSNSTLEPTSNSDKDLQLSKVANNKGLDQHVTNRAKEIVSGYDGITSIKAANSPKTMIIAIDVKQMKRFKLAEIRKEINKKVEDEFPDSDIVISTDKKIFLELDQLEKKMQSGSVTKKEVNKKVKELIKLAREET